VKTIGLLGGMSWESTVSYYEAINEAVKQALGGLHSAKVVLYSVDFAEIEALQHAGDWAATASILGDAGAALKAAGADFLLICTNTMHIVAQEVEAAAGIPLLHIADATADALSNDGIKRVGLLGTRFTMEQEFYVGRLRENHSIDVLIPDEPQRQRVHEIIYGELCLGRIEDGSRAEYLAIIESLSQRGAQAVILGCTEIALLVDQSHTSVPLYDTTAIHAARAVAVALGE
jgi:aspartate racemase